MAKHTPPPGWRSPLDPQQPLAGAPWIAGALAAVLILAAICVYCTFCLLFWQGQWQLVFKPSAAITVTPASDGLRYDEVAFDATETGNLQLHGWWIPADGAMTLLLLHGGTGSLSDTVPHLQALHSLGLNVFVFDYRGFGKSVPLHPSQASTYDDAEAAWHYLTDTRHLPPGKIVLDGSGLGAAIAAEVARRHPEAAALILEDAQPPALDSLQLDRGMRLLPIRLLFHDRFDPTEALAQLRMPKLYLSPTPNALYYEQAADPKQKAISANYASEAYVACLRNFLNKYIPGSLKQHPT